MAREAARREQRRTAVMGSASGAGSPWRRRRRRRRGRRRRGRGRRQQAQASGAEQHGRDPGAEGHRPRRPRPGRGLHAASFTPGGRDRQHVEGTSHYKHEPADLRPTQPAPGRATATTRPGRAADREPRPRARARPHRVSSTSRARPPREISQLETLFNEPIKGKPGATSSCCSRTTRRCPYAVAATAWGQQLGCKFDDKVFDAIRAFRVDLRRQGPRERPAPRVARASARRRRPGRRRRCRARSAAARSSSSSCQK